MCKSFGRGESYLCKRIGEVECTCANLPAEVKVPLQFYQVEGISLWGLMYDAVFQRVIWG